MWLVFLFAFHFCFCSMPSLAQWFSFGAKGGLPLTSTSDAVREIGRYGGQTSFRLNRYTVGPTIEIGLPWRLRLQADALYKHARQDLFSGPAPTGTLNQQGTRMDIWEIPVQLKYPLKQHGLQPFTIAGATLRRLDDLDIDLITIPTVPGFPGRRQVFTVSSDEPIRYGVTLGGGVSRNLRFAQLSLELRYTHWTAKRWMATTEQVEFLLGVTFPAGRAARGR